MHYTSLLLTLCFALSTTGIFSTAATSTGDHANLIVALDEILVKTRCGAGAFVMGNIVDVPHVLMGRRDDGRGWTTLGGMADIGRDITLTDAALREVTEESGNIFKLKRSQLEGAPSHDLVEAGFRFRQFFLNIVGELPPSNTIRDHEYMAYLWVPIKYLINPEHLKKGH